ncbi:MAG: FAD-binding oxidoreductase [Candidatus Binatia bacterium]
MTEPLPQGVAADAFRDAMAKLRKAIGQKFVVVDVAALERYRDHRSAIDADVSAPSAAVLPDGVDEIREVLRIANQYRLPLWTIGSAKHIAHGGPAGGSVVLDLQRMNRILEVNEDLAYALVEPGVTEVQLYEHLRKTKSRLWIDCTASSGSGVAGSALDHGIGYTPYADHFLMQCGMEVVLPDGAIVRTGMGAMPKSTAWQLFKFGYGPWLDGMFTQSNFAVVTKMGLWLMPEPPAYKPFMITLPREEDLRDAMEVLRPLKVNMVIPNSVAVAHLLHEVALQRHRTQLQPGQGPISKDALRALAQELGLGWWNIYGALYGIPEGIAETWEVVAASFGKISGAKFYGKEDRPGDPVWAYREQLMRGVPSATGAGIANWAGGGVVDFAQIAPLAGDDAMRLYRSMSDVVQAHGFDYIGEFVTTWRAVLNSLTISFDPADASARARARTCANAIITEAAEAGYGQATANRALMDAVAGTYGGFDGGLWEVHRRLKRELDPQGILSPGKSGI